jgi:regulator of replication initiation timing
MADIHIHSQGSVETTSDKDGIYREYVISQNQKLHVENRQLREETKTLESRLEELEDEDATNSERISKLKLYVKNFHLINEDYKTLLAQYNHFMIRRDMIQYSWLITLLLLPTLLYSTILSCIAVAVVAGGQYYYQSQATSARARLLASKQKMDKELEQVLKTMDIIGEFLDNA